MTIFDIAPYSFWRDKYKTARHNWRFCCGDTPRTAIKVILLERHSGQAAQRDQLLREIATLRRKLAASQELAAHRGHSLALTLEENRRLRGKVTEAEAGAARWFSYAYHLESAMERPPLTLNALTISSEVVSVADYAEGMGL